MKKFKDIKTGDFIFIEDNYFKVNYVEHKNGYIAIDNVYIPNNHLNASMVKIGNQMVFSDIKKWGRYLILKQNTLIRIARRNVYGNEATKNYEL